MTIDTLPSSPNGEITHGEVRAKINETIADVNKNSGELSNFPKSKFRIRSDDTYAISSDNLNPTYLLNGFAQEDGIAPVGWQIEAVLGGMRNISGKTLKYNGGVYSFHATNVNASVRELSIFSETSIDNGVTWTRNANSARKQTISGSAEAFNTKQSEAFNVPDQAILRFGFFASASGVSFTPVVVNPYGETVTGPSFRWRLTEDLDPALFID